MPPLRPPMLRHTSIYELRNMHVMHVLMWLVVHILAGASVDLDALIMEQNTSIRLCRVFFYLCKRHDCDPRSKKNKFVSLAFRYQ